MWHPPKTFLSLVQKAGRCGRKMGTLGEAVVFITRAAYATYLAELESERPIEVGREEEEGEVEDTVEGHSRGRKC